MSSNPREYPMTVLGGEGGLDPHCFALHLEKTGCYEKYDMTPLELWRSRASSMCWIASLKAGIVRLFPFGWCDRFITIDILVLLACRNSCPIFYIYFPFFTFSAENFVVEGNQCNVGLGELAGHAGGRASAREALTDSLTVGVFTS